MLITSGSYKVTRFSGYNNMDWEVSFLKHFSIFVHLSIGSYVSVRSSRYREVEGGGGRGGSMPSRFALYKLTQFPPTLDFLWVACTTTTNEQFDTNSVFCVNETLDTLPHSSLLKNTTLTLQLPDQICNSPYCQP